MNSAFSKPFIKPFIEKNGISLEGIQVPEGGFKSFNEFFYRKKLNLPAEGDANHIYSPCDGLLSAYKIQNGSVYDVKNASYTVEDLLGDRKLAEEYENGTILIFRLTPTHYHRYSFAADGVLSAQQRIEGILHCVRPIALRRYPVFAQNSREYSVIESPVFGKVVQMEVGAIMVGKITNLPVCEGMQTKSCKEKGYFEFGGSTIILLLQENKAVFDDIIEGADFEKAELPVKLGDCIARSANLI